MDQGGMDLLIHFIHLMRGFFGCEELYWLDNLAVCNHKFFGSPVSGGNVAGVGGRVLQKVEHAEIFILRRTNP
jgi:hypothetical protein